MHWDTKVFYAYLQLAQWFYFKRKVTFWDTQRQIRRPMLCPLSYRRQ